jgi:hypothetical protein
MSCSADDDDDDNDIMCHSYCNCYRTTKMPYGYKLHGRSYTRNYRLIALVTVNGRNYSRL